MKMKRYLTMLLSIVLILQLLPSMALAAVVSASDDYAKVNVLPEGSDKIVTNIDAFNVVNGAVSMTLSVQSSYAGKGSSTNMEARAVIVSASDYVTTGKGDNKPQFVTVTNWNQTNTNLNQTFWRYGNGKIADQKVTINNFKNNASATALRTRPMAVDNTGSFVVTANDCYYDDYVCILHISEVGTGADENYVVFKFQVDSEGNLKKDSYMVRYVKNTASIGTTAAVSGTVAPQITSPSAATTTLSSGVYTRTGYTFMGWDDDAQFLQKKGTGTVSATGTGTDYVNSLARMSDADAKAGMDYPVGGTNTAIAAQPQDSIYNLYAQWKPIGVNLTPVTNSGGLETKPHNEKYDATQAKVNKQFSWEFDVAGASGTTKGVIIETVREVQPGTETVIAGGTMNAAQFLTKYGLAVASEPTANMTNSGGVNLTSGTGGKIYLTGTPKIPTTNDLLVTIRTWDKTNFSYDTQVLRIKGIAKGAQPVPTLDANTGLQSRVVTTKGEDNTDVKDGQIFGFYSAGPKKDTDGMDTGYWAENTNGTGTMTQYYITNRMIYRYRPVLVDGKAVTYTNLPNDGWREVPLPSNWYVNSALDPVRTAYENSLKKNAAIVIETGYAPTNSSYAPVTVQTAPAGFTGWPDSYGWIEYDGTLPVVHGLTENDVYEIQFRENSSYGESDPQQITIGGAVAGSICGAGGLAVNLAGGTEQGSEDKYTELKSTAKALQPGGTLDLNTYNFEPTREGSAFLGWTLGERDGDGNLILYRAKEAEPPAPEMVSVKWIDGTDNSPISHTVTSVPKGTTVPEADYPTVPVHEGYTFQAWTVAVDETTGEITITATYTQNTPEPPTPEARDGEEAGTSVTVTWVDPLKDGDDKTIGEPKQVNLVDGNLPADLEHPAAPVHDGYTFQEWVTEKNEDGSYTVTAKYTQATAAKVVWIDGLTGETILEGDTTTTAPAKPYHMCYTAAAEWTKTTGEDGTETYTIAYTRNTVVPMPADTPASLAAVWEGGGSSDPDMSLVRTITFLDWDGSTKLGVVAVQKGYGMAASDYATMLEGRYNKSVMSLTDFTLTPTASEGYIYNPGRANAETAMLTDKGGYTFVGWVPGDAEFTHYPMGTDLSTIGLIDWSTYKVEDHMDVKACYVGNSKCGTANNVYYTVEYADIERSGANYTVRVNVSRYYSAERDAFPMRMQDPILRVQLNLNGSTTLVSLSVPLENKDYTSASFTFPAVMDRVQIAATDIYGRNDIAASAVARSRTIDLSNNANATRQNYLKYGTTYLVNSDARTATGTTASTRLGNFSNAAAFAPLDITVVGNGPAQTLSTNLLSAWRYLNGWTKPGSTWVKPAEEVKPEDEVTLTQPQIVAIHEDKANVYLRHVSFEDTDNRAEYIAGKFTWEVAQPADASVKTAAPAGFKIYWSRDGMTKRSQDPIAVTVTDGVYSISEGVRKQYYDRYLLVCAVDGSGAELPVSAAIPIIDFACD